MRLVRRLMSVVITCSLIVAAQTAPSGALETDALASVEDIGAREITSLVIKYRPMMRSKLVADDVAQQMSTMNISVAYTAPGPNGATTVVLSSPIPESAAESIADSYGADLAVEWAEPNYWAYPTTFPATTPNDALYADLWSLWSDFGVGIGAGQSTMTAAWGTTQGEGVTVAILDTGYIAHPDLNDRLVNGYDFVTSYTDGYVRYVGSTRAAGNNDGDVLATDTYGAVGRDSNPLDPGDWFYYSDGVNIALSASSWHGSHVAGTVAATANNGIGVVGVAPQARIQPIRVLGWNGGLATDIADAITWASGGTVSGVQANPTPSKIINLSLGGEQACPAVYQTAIDGAISRGSIVVVAAGNSAADAANFAPANCAGVVTVAATDRNGKLAPYSNYGSAVDIAAPGGSSAGGILSTASSTTTGPGAPNYAGGAPVPSYRAYQGTSMATPHVSGALALLSAAFPEFSNAALLQRLLAKTKALPTDACASPRVCGSGIASALAVEPDGQALIPLFDEPVQTLSGFRVNVTNYDPSFVFTVASSSGTVETRTAIGSTFPIKVSGLPVNAVSTLTVNTAKVNFAVGTAQISGQALQGDALLPVFGPRTVSNTGFTFDVTNYDTNFNFVVTSSRGTIEQGSVNGSTRPITVSGLTPGESATVTVQTSRTGYAAGARSVTAIAAASQPSTPSTPEIDSTSVAISPRTLVAGGMVGLTLVATDDIAVETVTVVLTTAGGQEIVRESAVQTDGTSIWSVAGMTIPLELRSQTLKVFAQALDAVTSSDLILVGELSVLGAEDTQLPTLSGGALAVSKAVTGDTVAVSFQASDDIGVLSVSAGAYKPAGEFLITGEGVRTAGTAQSGTWTVSLQLPVIGIGGQYEIRAQAVDAANKVAGSYALGSINVTPKPSLYSFVAEDAGFTSIISNFTSGFVYTATITSHTSASEPLVSLVDNKVAVTNLSSGATATVEIQVSRDGFDPASSMVTGQANTVAPPSPPPGGGGGFVGGGGGGGAAPPVLVTVVSGVSTPFIPDPSAPALFAAALPGGGNVNVEIPAGAAPTAGVIMLETAQPERGVVSIKMELRTSNGQSLTQFQIPLTITFGVVAADTSVVRSDDGLTWALIPRLSLPQLGQDQVDGYYVKETGDVVVLTKHLSYFAAKKMQTPLQINSIASTLLTGTTTQLVVTGGSGQGKLKFTSLTPTCAVTDVGIIRALMAGECTIAVVRASDDVYLESAQSRISTLVFGTAVSETNTATRPTMSVSGTPSRRIILIGLGSEFGERLITLQMRLATSKTWRTLRTIRLGVSGKAKTIQRVPSRSQLRVRAGSRTVVSSTVR